MLGPNGLLNPLITRPGPGMHAYFDPPIREAALVTINGQPAGALWHPPYRLDVTKLLKPGTNQIEIHVYNTALNAWSGLPPHDYKPLIAKFGDRFQMQDLDKVKPIPSGILGTIKLVTETPAMNAHPFFAQLFFFSCFHRAHARDLHPRSKRLRNQGR